MSRRNRNTKRIIYPFVLIAFFILLGLIYFIWALNIHSVNPAEDKYTNFSIDKGASLTKIAEDLKRQNFIKSKNSFLIAVKLMGIDSVVQAGDFRLSRSMNLIQIARKLTDSSTDVRVTIPEGKRAEEIAEILENNIPTVSSEKIGPSLAEHNGYIFPDTYNFERDMSYESILEIMRNNFEEKYQTIENKVGLTKQEIVIIASLIEREARHDEDRALVSSVIHNRLSIGMKLDIDATIQYALGYNSIQKTWWKKGLTIKDLAVNSPYNTYMNAGLPPSPIANPGLAALKASANPSDSDYLYYITDKNGINRYAKTLEEHNANIRNYGL